VYEVKKIVALEVKSECFKIQTLMLLEFFQISKRKWFSVNFLKKTERYALCLWPPFNLNGRYGRYSPK
jgi:hypothetical protein